MRYCFNELRARGNGRVTWFSGASLYWTKEERCSGEHNVLDGPNYKMSVHLMSTWLLDINNSLC